MCRRTVVRAAAVAPVLALVGGLWSAPPAGARPLDGLDGEPARVEAGARGASLGVTRAPNRKLRRGCHNYGFRYRVSPPRDEWQAEIFLIDPRSERLAHHVFDSGSEPRRGKSHWRICRPSTKPGRFRMEMKVSWYDLGDVETGWAKPGRFRLTRR